MVGKQKYMTIKRLTLFLGYYEKDKKNIFLFVFFMNSLDNMKCGKTKKNIRLSFQSCNINIHCFWSNMLLDRPLSVSFDLGKILKEKKSNKD